MTNEAKERAIRWLTEEVRSLRLAPTVNGCKPDNWEEQLEIMETCLEAVRGCNQVANKSQFGCDPLTMEQLREMGGQPYWHVGLQDDSPEPHWKILDLFVAKHPEDYGYGKRWLAYAYPPAHIDMEAWTAEWIKHDGYTECSKCEHWYDSPESEDDGDRPAFCPSCGRAMTDEAVDMVMERLEALYENIHNG